MKTLAALILAAAALCAQSSITAPDRIRNVATAPTVGAACVNAQAMQRDVSAGSTSGHLFSCENSVWVDISGTSSGSPFSAAGTFNNTVMTTPLQGLINGANLTTDYQIGQTSSNFDAIGVGGGVVVPANSTNHDASGVFGTCQGNNVTTNCSGMYTAAYAGTGGSGTTDATRVRLWGFNPLTSDNGKLHVLLTNELDFNVSSTDTHILGLQLTGAGTQDMTSDSVGILIGPIGTSHQWPNGFQCSDGATSVACIQLGVTGTGNNLGSQTARFLSRTSGGVVNTMDLKSGPGGAFLMNTSNTSGTIYAVQSATNNQLLVGMGGALTQTGFTLANLAPTTNGTVIYCTDCTNVSNPCTGSGTGAIAKRLNGAWDCR